MSLTSLNAAYAQILRDVSFYQNRLIENERSAAKIEREHGAEACKEIHRAIVSDDDLLEEAKAKRDAIDFAASLVLADVRRGSRNN